MQPLQTSYPKVTTAILACSAISAGIGLSLRTYLNPVRISTLGLRSPLGPESIFAIALLLILWVRAGGGAAGVRPKTSVATVFLFPSLLILLIAGTFMHGLSAPFLSDDYIIINTPFIDVAGLRQLLQTPGGDGSYRPLA